MVFEGPNVAPLLHRLYPCTLSHTYTNIRYTHTYSLSLFLFLWVKHNIYFANAGVKRWSTLDVDRRKGGRIREKRKEGGIDCLAGCQHPRNKTWLFRARQSYWQRKTMTLLAIQFLLSLFWKIKMRTKNGTQSALFFFVVVVESFAL